MISPAWGRGKGLTLSINHFFFPPPICSVILLLLHTPLILDRFISLSLSLLVLSWVSALLAPSFLQRCCPMIWFSFLAPYKKKGEKRHRRKKRKILQSVQCLIHLSLDIMPLPSGQHLQPKLWSTCGQCLLPSPPLRALPRGSKPDSSTSFSSSCFH